MLFHYLSSARTCVYLALIAFNMPLQNLGFSTPATSCSWVLEPLERQSSSWRQNSPALRPINHPPKTLKLGSNFRREIDGKVAKLSYQWIDHYATAVNPSKRRHYQTQLDLDKISLAIYSFGIPEHMMKSTITYRTQSELQQKKQKRGLYVYRRGFLKGQGNSVRPNFDWMIQQSRKDIQTIADDLQELAIKHGAKNQRQIVETVSSFVQGLKYQVPDEHRPAPLGQDYRIYTAGINMPLETLYNGWGDCDSKSVLLATLLTCIKGYKVIFLRGDNHCFVGVAMTPKAKDHFTKFHGDSYVLIEATSYIPIGRIDKDHWQAVQRNEFEIIPAWVSNSTKKNRGRSA
jgi:hypothetical protein